MTTNLVVADLTRTEKTICLAVTPALKAHGIPGRARLFEVIQKVREINAQRRQRVPSHVFSGSSSNDLELRANPALELDYIVAPPRMARYMEWSARIYQVYLRHVAPEDIHPYSIDEVFMDIAPYLQPRGNSQSGWSKMYLTPLELPPPRGSVPTSTSAKLRWTSSPNISDRTRTASALRG